MDHSQKSLHPDSLDIGELFEILVVGAGYWLADLESLIHQPLSCDWGGKSARVSWGMIISILSSFILFGFPAASRLPGVRAGTSDFVETAL